MENSNSAGTIPTIVIAATNSGAGKTSISLGLERIYSVKRRSGSVNCIEGFRKNNILATYMHLHFASRAHTIENFVKTMEMNRGK